MFSILVGVFLFVLNSVQAFYVVSSPAAARRISVARSLGLVDPSVVVLQEQQQQLQPLIVWQQQQLSTTTSPLTQGVHNYWHESSSLNVALQERKIPTAEEIAAKKRNFNLLFWGGGFVAPFLATIFYFGFDFWKK